MRELPSDRRGQPDPGPRNGDRPHASTGRPEAASAAHSDRSRHRWHLGSERIRTPIRKAREEDRGQVGPGRIGKVAKFFADEPQSTTAWAKGADGEVKLAKRLDRDLDGCATMLHDRKVPKTKGNLDHLVVAPTGVWIIDAKNYSGKVERRDVGNGRTIDQRLYVGGRNQTKLVASMGWQADAVQFALDSIGLGAVPIHRCICFTDAEWGFFSKPFTIEDVWIGWPKALAETIQGQPALDDAAVTTLSHHLSTWFPASR